MSSPRLNIALGCSFDTRALRPDVKHFRGNEDAGIGLINGIILDITGSERPLLLDPQWWLFQPGKQIVFRNRRMTHYKASHGPKLHLTHQVFLPVGNALPIGKKCYGRIDLGRRF